MTQYIDSQWKDVTEMLLRFYLHIFIVKLEINIETWSAEIPDLGVFVAMKSLIIIV